MEGKERLRLRVRSLCSDRPQTSSRSSQTAHSLPLGLNLNLSPVWIDVLTADGWEAVQLGNGPSADGGAGHACPHHGVDEPEAHGGAVAPLELRHPVRGMPLSVAAQRARHHHQREPHRQLPGQCLCRMLFAAFTRECISHRPYRTQDEATQNIFEYIKVCNTGHL